MNGAVANIVLPPGAAYAATKWALEALVEALAIEVAPFGVQAAVLETRLRELRGPRRRDHVHPARRFPTPQS